MAKSTETQTETKKPRKPRAPKVELPDLDFAAVDEAAVPSKAYKGDTRFDAPVLAADKDNRWRHAKLANAEGIDYQAALIRGLNGAARRLLTNRTIESRQVDDGVYWRVTDKRERKAAE